jgi:putative ABC transport system permease protein
MNRVKFWLRWTGRDLRARWLQVLAIALIIALGTGIFSGFGGQEKWRTDSYDLSYNSLNMYDLRMELTDGNFVDSNELLAALEGIDGVKTMETRLVLPTQVDASTNDETILVKGRLVGVDVTNGGPYVNSIFVDEKSGRNLTADDSGQDVAIVEYKFAQQYELEPGDPIRISGDVSLDFVGAGHSPEYFIVQDDTGIALGEATFAVIFMPLESVQNISGHAGESNELVVLIDDPDNHALRQQVEDEIKARVETTFPDMGVAFNVKEDDPGFKLNYEDAKNDQGLWNSIAALFLLGAAMGAFNLAGRIVESQRRQIGIGMALGVPRFWIAFRPMLIGLQIALLGTIFGLIAGLGLTNLFAELVKSFAPLPYWDISLHMPSFIGAAVLGILLPVIATLIPTLRAVRVQPIDAIRSGHLIAKGGGLSWLMNYLPIPGKSFTQMPFRNILRSPWRTILTVLGVSVAILLMVVFIGFYDSFVATIDQAEDAYMYQGADRVIVNLDGFYLTDSDVVTNLSALKTNEGEPLFSDVDTNLIVGGTLMNKGEEIETSIELLNIDSTIWVPDLDAGSLESEQVGIIISEKSADDLGVSVGDNLRLEHVLLVVNEGVPAFRLAEDDVKVIGIHNNPFRPLSYMSLDHADLMGVAGQTNEIVVNPSNEVSADEVKAVLFTQPGVAAVQTIASFSEAFDEALGLFGQFLRVIQVVVLIMAFLIAFNSTSINVDERVREIATMFAFGLPIRTVTRMQVIENMLIGILGTLVGIVLGWLTLQAFIGARLEEQLEDINFITAISPTTILISAILGILVVALTPLLSIRKMSKMDIPSTLRVME